MKNYLSVEVSKKPPEGGFLGGASPLGQGVWGCGPHEWGFTRPWCIVLTIRPDRIARRGVRKGPKSRGAPAELARLVRLFRGVIEKEDANAR